MMVGFCITQAKVNLVLDTKILCTPKLKLFLFFFLFTLGHSHSVPSMVVLEKGVHYKGYVTKGSRNS